VPAPFSYLVSHWGGQRGVGGWPDKLFQWLDLANKVQLQHLGLDYKKRRGFRCVSDL